MLELWVEFVSIPFCVIFLVWSKFSIIWKAGRTCIALFRIKSGSVGRSGRNSKVEEPVAMLQIVMVGPGTHLVKNHESLAITNKSQFKKRSPELKILGPL